VILSYSNDEVVQMIESFSKLQIFSIYLVDSFGSMQNDDLRSILSILQSHLPHTITIGFHAHNNLQLAFSNALAFIDGKHDDQQVIIDSSIMGMGRGAGNLNTELICDHLCKYFNSNYDILGVLSIIDTDFEFLKNKYNWGYKIAYFLSATCHCHPNYGTFFTDKKNLSVKNIFHILSLIPNVLKNNFDNYFSEQLYIDFLTKVNKSINYVKGKVIENSSRPILIIASGPSVIKEKNKINDFIKKHSPYIFVVNHYSEIFSKPDFYFFSNQNRFDKFKRKISLKNTIVTSNIQTNNIDQREGIRYVDFSKIISNSKNNINNVSIYLIKFLMQNDQIENFYFAGLDGFNPLNYDQNYSYNEFHIYNQENMLKINELLSSELSFLSKKVNIKSITASKVLSS
jgi:4-hydroxy 2-oxovalerate aldolase